MAQVRDAAQAVMASGCLGLLHGVPFTVNDIVNIEGVTTTSGAKLGRDVVPNE